MSFHVAGLRPALPESDVHTELFMRVLFQRPRPRRRTGATFWGKKIKAPRSPWRVLQPKRGARRERFEPWRREPPPRIRPCRSSRRIAHCPPAVREPSRDEQLAGEHVNPVDKVFELFVSNRRVFQVVVQVLIELLDELRRLGYERKPLLLVCDTHLKGPLTLFQDQKL